MHKQVDYFDYNPIKHNLEIKLEVDRLSAHCSTEPWISTFFSLNERGQILGGKAV